MAERVLATLKNGVQGRTNEWPNLGRKFCIKMAAFMAHVRSVIVYTWRRGNNVLETWPPVCRDAVRRRGVIAHHVVQLARRHSLGAEELSMGT